MSKRTLIGLLVTLLVLVLAVAAMIFLFSSENRSNSSSTSRKLVDLYLRLTHPGFDQLRAKEKRVLRRRYQEPVRKVAHGVEFMLLGMFLYLLLHGFKLRFAWLITWLGGTLYAAFDEWHQTLVEGRSGAWRDVCIDSGGVVIGILVGMALLALFRRIFEKDREGDPGKA